MDFADPTSQPVRTLRVIVPIYLAGVLLPQSNGQYPRCWALDGQRHRIVQERGRNPDPSSRCIDPEQNALLPGWVGDAEQFAPPCELCFSNPQSAGNNGKSRRKLMRAARGQAQSSGRARLPACKVVLRSCNPPAACRDFGKFDSPASKTHKHPDSASVWLLLALAHPYLV